MKPFFPQVIGWLSAPGLVKPFGWLLVHSLAGAKSPDSADMLTDGPFLQRPGDSLPLRDGHLTPSGTAATGSLDPDECRAVPAQSPTLNGLLLACRAALEPWLGTVVRLWSCGVLLFSIRPVWSGWVVHRLHTEGVSPVEESVHQALDRLRAQLSVGRQVQILQSSLVCAPVVIGCFRSVILLPVSFVAGVSLTQLEAILAHELAHERRYDYAVNLLQILVETVFFYHPAVWWLSHRIRVERENCCDDLAVAVLGNRVAYGRALLAVEEFRGAAATAVALSARGDSLSRRVQRLFTDPPNGGDTPSAARLVPLGMLSVLLVAAVLWLGIPAPSVATVSDEATAPIPFERPAVRDLQRRKSNRPVGDPVGPVAEGFFQSRARLEQSRSRIDQEQPGTRHRSVAGRPAAGPLRRTARPRRGRHGRDLVHRVRPAAERAGDDGQPRPFFSGFPLAGSCRIRFLRGTFPVAADRCRSPWPAGAAARGGTG